MKLLRKLLDKQAALFEKGGKLEKFEALYEANDTFLFTPGKVTTGASHVRDALDLKRLMSTVILALIPCFIMAVYNTGLQANLAIQGGLSAIGWRGALIEKLGVGFSPDSILACCLHGLLYFGPVFIVSYAAGGFWEVIFATVRKHEINEGFLVTGALLPLIVPPTIPLWQLALGISFGVVIGKEVFGGTGMNFLNPALVARAFLFFAYPASSSGVGPWVAVDGYTTATPLLQAAEGGMEAVHNSVTWMQSFLGFEAGSMGETSTLACLLGAVVLIVTGVGSWRIMLSVAIGTAVTALGLNAIGSDTNPAFAVPFYWHFVMGGWAFGTVFMATDPVSGPYTYKASWIYGFLIGVLVVLVRVVNPAFPEGMMLAILFMNAFAPLFDYFVLRANIKRRLARNALQ